MIIMAVMVYLSCENCKYLGGILAENTQILWMYTIHICRVLAHRQRWNVLDEFEIHRPSFQMDSLGTQKYHISRDSVACAKECSSRAERSLDCGRVPVVLVVESMVCNFCWLVVWNIWIIFPYTGNGIIIPTDFNSIIFQRGRAQPPTSLVDVGCKPTSVFTQHALHHHLKTRFVWKLTGPSKIRS